MSESSSKPTINTRMPKGAKRPKTSRACLACRKLKARCEPAGGTKAAPSDDPQPSSLSFVICHRCKTLCIDCLYETPAGEVVQGEDVQPAISSPSPAEEHNRAPRSSKRSRPEDAPSSDPFSNDRAVFLSPAISPSSLTRSIYRDVEICSLNTLQPAYLERPVLPANALSRLIGANPALKREAQDYILNLSGAFGSGSTHSWKQAPPDLCAGKAAARLMAGHAPLPAYPHDELEFLGRILQPHEHQLRILFHGLYGAFSPFLSTPFEDSLILSNAQSEAQSFVLLTIYLAAFPHLEASQPIAQAKAPLRKANDALLRRAIQSPQSDHLNIFALHNCASFLLLPVDGLAENCRPISTPEQEVDGLLEFAPDLNPRATIITALIVAQRLGYASLAARLPSLRQSFDVDSPQNGYSGDSTRDEYAHAVLCTFTWLTLLQFRASIDVAEDRVEWDSLAQFERDIPRVRIDAMTAALQPPPAFLSPREQSRCCWMAQRAELYGIARDHRHTKRAAASFTKREAEDQAMGYKKALDEWRYKFGEQMRSMSTEFRKDPRGLGLHRFYSIFSNAEAASLQVAIGSVYHKEFVADMRQRLAEPFFSDGLPWKSAATILLGHEEDQLTKAILINFAFTDAMLKAMGLISSLTPVMPQLYDFVSYEESAGSEIPSLCIVAPPNLQAGLFAVPLLAAADLRLSVIETWGASASYFNHHVMPLLTNCVKSLRACHVNVDLPGVLKIPFATANPIADYLQGPFEILMRKVASAEERLQISHVESILNNSFLLSSKKKQIETAAEELAPDVPEMVQAIADSKKIEDEISAAMMGALNVQSIREIQDTDFAVKVFGSDLREGDVKAIRKPGRNGSSSATTPDAERNRRGPSNARSSSVESEQTGSPSVLTHSSKQRTPMHRSVRSVANASQYSSPSSSTQSGNAALPEPAVVYHKDPSAPPQGLEQTPAVSYAHPPTAYEASVLQPPSQSHEQALPSSYAPISQTAHAGPTYAPAYAERSIDAPHGYSGSTSGVHGMDAYASYPNERYPAESVLGLDAGHAGAAGTAGTGSADVYAYRSEGDHVPAPTHAAGYDGMQRQGAKAEGAGYDGYGNVQQEHPQVSEPWQQQHAQQQHVQQPQGYGGAYGGDAASGQAYYGQHVNEQQYAEPYAPVYDQGHYQVGQGQHQVAQGQHGATIWDAWNWTPGQDQPPHHQHPHQQQGHHPQHQQHQQHHQHHQHPQHPHQQGQHHQQQYRN